MIETSDNNSTSHNSPSPLDYASGSYTHESGGQARGGLMLIAFAYGILCGGVAGVLPETGCLGMLPIFLLTMYPAAKAQHRKQMLDTRSTIAILLQTLTIGPTLLIIVTLIAFVRDDPGFPQSRFRLAAIGPGIIATALGVTSTCIAFAIDRRKPLTSHTIRTATP